MTSLQNATSTNCGNVRNDRSWPDGKSTNLEMQIHYSSRDNCRERENSRSRLKLNDYSFSSGVDNGDDHQTLPAEYGKTLLCFLTMSFVLACNLFFVGVIHDRTPTQRNHTHLRHPPLHDIGLDISSLLNVDKYMLLTISEVLLVVTTIFVVFILCFHEYKSIVFRRMFFLLTLLFSVRLFSMNLTMLPISSEVLYKCETKSHNASIGLLTSRFIDLISSCGLFNVKYCGNYLFSGHTVVFVLNYLIVGEYCPSWIINLPLKAFLVCGLALVSLSSYDYTVSIISAYYITTRLFWVYHTVANNASLKNLNEYSVNQICKEWWYPIFKYLEGNVNAVVPAIRH